MACIMAGYLITVAQTGSLLFRRLSVGGPEHGKGRYQGTPPVSLNPERFPLTHNQPAKNAHGRTSPRSIGNRQF